MTMKTERQCQRLQLITFRVIRMGMIYIFVQIGQIGGSLLTDLPLAPPPIEKRAIRVKYNEYIQENTTDTFKKIQRIHSRKYNGYIQEKIHGKI